MSYSNDRTSGVALNSATRPTKAYQRGRVCNEPECGTKLSVYNHGKFCYVHEPLAVPRTRGRKIA